MNISAIVQARLGSKRLPGKVLLPIVGKPMLWHIVSRLRSVPAIADVVIATSREIADEAICRFGEDAGIPVYRGSEADVLDRFYKTALATRSKTIMRITADCPLVDPGTVAKLIELYQTGRYDYCGVATGAGVSKEDFVGKFPDGLDAEVFSFDALETAWREATSATHHEHATLYIWQQPDRFRIGNLKSEHDYSEIRLTVDNDEDFQLISWIYESLYTVDRIFTLDDVIALLRKNPDRLKLNTRFIGTEGYERLWE